MSDERQASQGDAGSVTPSSAPSGHLLPQREKGNSGSPAFEPPSPLVGEGTGVRGLGAPPATAPEFSDKTHRRTERRNRGFAKSMRRNPTEAERQFWLLLKDRRFSGFKFRRQVPIGPYIADFVCYSARLIVELDGSQHAEDPRDTTRDAELAPRGFTLLRIWNNDLTANPAAVADAVWHNLTETADGPH